jgi:sporulation protein YlmC with PRC-barrel domain
MEFLPDYNVNDEKYDIGEIDKYNVRFDIDDGDLLSLACIGHTSKWFKFKFGYCNEKKIIIPFELINNVLNKDIDVYFEYFNDGEEEPMFKIHLKNFKFTSYLNLFGFFNDTILDECDDRDIKIEDEEELKNIKSNLFNYINDDNREDIKVFYTFSGFVFENCDINRARMDKIDDITDSKDVNHFVGKEVIQIFDEKFELKKVD